MMPMKKQRDSVTNLQFHLLCFTNSFKITVFLNIGQNRSCPVNIIRMWSRITLWPAKKQTIELCLKKRIKRNRNTVLENLKAMNLK